MAAAAALEDPQSPSPSEDFRQETASSLSFQTSDAEIVHLVVGKSVQKMRTLLRWTFAQFPGREICLIYVHCPSQRVPTLLGKLPASGANPETLLACRYEERKLAMNILSVCLTICRIARVKASVIAAEADEMQKGIVDLVERYGIKKLVFGAFPKFMKGKRSSSKDYYAARTAPEYCQTWCVNNGRLIWTRQGEISSVGLPNLQSETKTLDASTSDSPCNSTSASLSNEVGSDLFETIDESYIKCLNLKQLEAEVLEASSKAEALETDYFQEVKLREDAICLIAREQNELSKNREQATQQLHKLLLEIACLDGRLVENKLWCEQVSGELKQIQASITATRKEKQKLQQQKIDAIRWLDKYRTLQQSGDDIGSFGLSLFNDVSELPEFVLSDIEAATCNFSDSFNIGQGSTGIVYKGEMLDKTVAIKKLHLYNLPRQIDYNEVVQVLNKLQHPRLVELIGTCLEAWLLIYEYLPGASLDAYLYGFKRSSLTWKERAQIVADIASGLLFLHSFRPQELVHGNLKPENLLFDCEGRCKISDYVDHMLTGGNKIRCPSFRGSSYSNEASTLLYTDPEFLRTGEVSQKSDIYSFGVIILQLLTGNMRGTVSREVRWAFSNGMVGTILDPSAGEWPSYVARRLLELGLKCCERNSQDRPEISPLLVKELENMIILEEQTVPAYFQCPIIREVMYDPQMAADGFTYEGESIREWLGNGNKTSPMTNLELSHTNLTPNHSLKLCIQDWILNLKTN